MESNNEQFSFCIGRTWDEYPSTPKSQICVYAYGSEVHHGTLEKANSMREYAESQEPGKKYSVYKLVKIDDNLPL